MSPQKRGVRTQFTELQRQRRALVDIVKDDSEPYAVFTEQGSPASQMTAPKIMDVVARLPGCEGQAADAVSSNTEVKMEDKMCVAHFCWSNRKITWMEKNLTHKHQSGPAKWKEMLNNALSDTVNWQKW